MVIGKKEAEERSLSVRRLGSDKNISYDLNTIVDEISNESKSPVNT
jgi:threonyl-tRNA synthetase